MMDFEFYSIYNRSCNYSFKKKNVCNEKKTDKQMSVSLSDKDSKSLLEDYHNGPFISSPDFPTV